MKLAIYILLITLFSSAIIEQNFGRYGIDFMNEVANMDTVTEGGWNYTALETLKKQHMNLEIKEYENTMVLYFNDIKYMSYSENI